MTSGCLSDLTCYRSLGLATWSPLALHTQQVPSTTGPLRVIFCQECHLIIFFVSCRGLSYFPKLQEADHVPSCCTHAWPTPPTIETDAPICIMESASSPSSSLGAWVAGLLLMLHSPQPSCLEDCKFPQTYLEGGANPSSKSLLWGDSCTQQLTFSYHHLPTPSPQGFVF